MQAVSGAAVAASVAPEQHSAVRLILSRGLRQGHVPVLGLARGFLPPMIAFDLTIAQADGAGGAVGDRGVVGHHDESLALRIQFVEEL